MSIPLAPVLLSPTSGASINEYQYDVYSGSPTGDVPTANLTWNVSSGATSYRIQVSVDPAFGSFIADQSGLTATGAYYTPTLSNGSYYWRVNATNGDGTSSWSSVWSFGFSYTSNGVAAAVIYSPSNSATNISPTSVTIVWSGGTTGFAGVEAQIATDAAFVHVVVDQGGTNTYHCTTTALSASTTYYWKVINNGWGNNVTPVYQFTTGIISPPLTVNVGNTMNIIYSLLQPTIYATQDIEVDFVGVPVVGTAPLQVQFTATTKFSSQVLNVYNIKSYTWCFNYDPINGNCIGDYVVTTSNPITHIYEGYKGQQYNVKVCVTLEVK